MLSGPAQQISGVSWSVCGWCDYQNNAITAAEGGTGLGCNTTANQSV